MKTYITIIRISRGRRCIAQFITPFTILNWWDHVRRRWWNIYQICSL